MAAGCTIAAHGLPTFEAAWQEVAGAWLDSATLQRRLDSDGALPAAAHTLETVELLDAQVWGQGFAPPVFSAEAEVLQQRILGERHLGLRLRLHDRVLDGIWFGHSEPLPERALVAYRIACDDWQGQQRLRLFIEGVQAP
jgi:single-stranded-DNA-specific exonuclease